ncbi:DUF6101 family protein [Ahrensia sp. 13_GOM-1096m]|uniref:DUF6101 family protein n=1 Tax=Ahrensia sp. 13_GOM-1096m TaxID=1380380 RepID=UPI000683EC7E|nr:DUF6101 family protein [Ahrensia sp. 13_GOM-1096m]
MSTVAQPVWAGQEFRLDPTRLPQQVSYASRVSGKAVEITVNKRGAVLKHSSETDLADFNIALPNNSFRGVAARATETGPDTALVTLELLHEDEALCVPLRVGHELADIATDWQLWAELLKLPMMIIDADGVARTLEESAANAVINDPNGRGHNAMFAEDRPRYTARRRLGNLGVRLMVDGKEIIARN